MALSFVHQIVGPDLTGHRLLQISWALLYTYVFALILQYRVLTPLNQATRHRLRVAAILPEGPGVVSIEIEGRHLTELRAEPGQFFRWRFLTPDTWRTAYPFSLSAPPTDDRLRLTVKALGQGTAHVQAIAVGTWIVAEGPYGAMTAARRTRRNVLLIAGGVGITPMRALFETLPVRPGHDLTLLYRARGAEDLVFRHELEQIAWRRDARLLYLVGSDHDCLTAPALLRVVPDLAERDVYLCASPRMSDAVRLSLRKPDCRPASCTRNDSRSEGTAVSHGNLINTRQPFLSAEPRVVSAGQQRTTPPRNEDQAMNDPTLRPPHDDDTAIHQPAPATPATAADPTSAEAAGPAVSATASAPVTPTVRWHRRRLPLLVTGLALILGCLLGGGIVAVGALVGEGHHGDDRGSHSSRGNGDDNADGDDNDGGAGRQKGNRDGRNRDDNHDQPTPGPSTSSSSAVTAPAPTASA